MSTLQGSPEGPQWRDMPVSRAFLYTTFMVPSKGAPPSRFPSQSCHRERERDALFTEPRFHLSTSLVNVPTLGFPTGPLWRDMPVSRAFLYISFRVPTKGAPTPRFCNIAPIERDAPFPKPSNCLSELPVNRPPHILSGARMERDAHLQSLLQHIRPRSTSPLPGCPAGPPWREMPFPWALFHISFRISSKGAPLQVPLTELPQREMFHFRSPPSTISQNSQ